MSGILFLVGGVILAALGAVGFVERDRVQSLGHSVVEEMHGLVGTLYRWGGKDPSAGGLDCSGAVTYVLQKLGVVPKGWVKSADDLYRDTERVVFPQAGDFAFYGTPSHVSHVMVVVGDGRVLGATGGGQSTTSEAIAKQQGAMVKYEPVDYRRDLVGFGRLPVRRSA